MLLYNNILVVDDDPTQRVVLEAYLETLGVETSQFAADGDEALRMVAANQGQIDLIVTDLNMPNLDGIEFIRCLKKQNFEGGIIVISSLGQNLIDNAANLTSMHGFNFVGSIRKPLNKQALDNLFFGRKTVSAEPKRNSGDLLAVDAIARAIDANEIVPFFQPKLNLLSGDIVGAEALARWINADGSIVSPDRFIPVAEAHGLIGKLNFSMIRQVFEIANRHRETWAGLKLAINITPRDLENLNFPDRVLEMARQYAIDPKTICLEVTESGVTAFDTNTLEVMSRLRVNEFELSIDDFGTGASNIANLRQFPYTELKIDQSFVMNLATDEFSAQTVKTSISLARQLGLRVVAEGVEDAKTLGALKSLGVDEVQGYLIAKPMAVTDFANFIEGASAPDRRAATGQSARPSGEHYKHLRHSA